MANAHSFLAIGLIALVGCTDHYNDMVNWADEEIPDGATIDSVKSLQPDYLVIAWDSPDTLSLSEETNSLTLAFDIVEIKGNRDILNMQNLLVFTDGRYKGRWARK
ncbi:MAG: hypothetical protein KDB96_19015 [Flavobacteriales bacterium]|nr:hypothetical protein [Flavobacteriales bacterium]